MPFSLNLYTRAAQPATILDILSEDLMRSLMEGFLFRADSGVTLLYDVDGNMEDLRRLDTFQNGDRGSAENWSDFCVAYRLDTDNNAECEACDLRHAREAYAQAMAGPEATEYRCHMGLVDMYHPLTVGGRVRAVLFAGQLVAEPLRQMDARVAAIEDDDLRVDLQEIAAKDLVEADVVEGRLAAFTKFAAAVQQAVDEVQAAKRMAALQTAVGAISRHLAAQAGRKEKDFRAAASEVIIALSSALGGVELVVLARERSRYVRLASTPGTEGLGRPTLPVRHGMRWPAERLHPLEGDAAIREVLAARFGVAIANTTAYRVVADATPNGSQSTLLLVQGDLRAEDIELATACFRAIGRETSSAGLLWSAEQERSVGERDQLYMAHALKTPLQTLMFLLRRLLLLRIEEPRAREDRDGLVRQAQRQLRSALYDALSIQTSRTAAEEFDLRVILRDSVDLFDERCRDAEIELRLDIPPSPVKVDAAPSDVRVALSNLMDNAVKYSYADGGQGRYIDVRLAEWDESYCEISIQNFGVGFSEEDRAVVFELGGRAEVEDAERLRQGWGYGIPHAVGLLEANGGALDIDSWPADENPREDRQRFVTTAYVTLPTVGPRA